MRDQMFSDGTRLRRLDLKLLNFEFRPSRGFFGKREFIDETV